MWNKYGQREDRYLYIEIMAWNPQSKWLGKNYMLDWPVSVSTFYWNLGIKCLEKRQHGSSKLKYLIGCLVRRRCIAYIIGTLLYVSHL